MDTELVGYQPLALFGNRKVFLQRYCSLFDFIFKSPCSTRVQAPNNTSDSSSRINDAVPLNPPGRGAVDASLVVRKTLNQKTNKKITKPKINKKISKPLLISTYNVRSLAEEWKQWELVCKAKAFNIPVIALQEHRIKDSLTITRDGYKFILAPPSSKSLLGVSFYHPGLSAVTLNTTSIQTG